MVRECVRVCMCGGVNTCITVEEARYDVSLMQI